VFWPEKADCVLGPSLARLGVPEALEVFFNGPCGASLGAILRPKEARSPKLLSQFDHHGNALEFPSRTSQSLESQKREHQGAGIAMESIRKQWVLIIAISEYRDIRLPTLAGVTQDANLLKVTIQEHGAYPLADLVLDLRDSECTKKNICDSLLHISRIASPDDQVVVYLAGHGGLKEPGDSSFVPYDADISDLHNTAIDSKVLAEAFGMIKAKQIVCLIDCCRSATIATQVVNSLSSAAADRDWIVIATCRSEQLVEETDAGGYFIRPFCAALCGSAILPGLRGGIDISDAIEHVKGHLKSRIINGISQRLSDHKHGNPIFITRLQPIIPPNECRRILLIEDDHAYGQPMRDHLVKRGFQVLWLNSILDLTVGAVNEFYPDLAIIDLFFGEELRGIEAVRVIRGINPLLPILVATQHATPELATQAIKAGADDFFPKGGNPDSEEFASALVSMLEKIGQEKRQIDIPQLIDRLAKSPRDHVLKQLLIPLATRKGFRGLKEHVLVNGLKTINFLIGEQTVGFGQSQSIAILCVKGNVNQTTQSPDNHLASALLEDVRDILRSELADPHSGRKFHVDTIALFATGMLSNGARNVLRIDPRISDRITIHDGRDFIGMLKTEGLLHRIIQTVPVTNTQVVFVNVIPKTNTITWRNLFYGLLNTASMHYPFNVDRAWAGLLNKERIFPGVGLCDIGEVHCYDPMGRANIIITAITPDLLNWRENAEHWERARVGLLSLIAGDEGQQHALLLRNIVRQLRAHLQGSLYSFGNETAVIFNAIEEFLTKRLTALHYNVSFIHTQYDR
jgi:ActR/RegA family two-component response regulator